MPGEALNAPEAGATIPPKPPEEYTAPQGYDHLLDPDWEDPRTPEQAVEDAAVRPAESLPTLAAEARDEVDAALRARIPQPSLSAAEIAQRRGGQWPTQEDVEGINKARAAGKHLG